jgi:rhodanese-related sulfurtransferase
MSSLPLIITKTELKELMTHGNITLIDVREKSETDLGRIPTAKLAPGKTTE